jgi:hypothetical protein
MSTKSEASQIPPEYRFGRTVVLLLYLGMVGWLCVVCTLSIFRTITAKPKILIPPASQKEQGMSVKFSRFKRCVKKLRALDREMEHEATSLWFRVRTGDRRFLAAWKDWARDWRHRMVELQLYCLNKKRCPIRGVGKMVGSFCRTSLHLLQLQKLQEKGFGHFYQKADKHFLQVRRGFHVLKEEMR